MTSTGQCGTCHNATAGSSPPTSGSHSKHAGAQAGGGYAFACTTCHYGFSETGLTHVDGKVNITIDSQLGGSASAAGQPVQRNFSSSTCSNTYCHSGGTSVASGSVPANTSANWGSSTLPCNSCHGTSTPNGLPDYPNRSPKANSHARHNLDCNNCHYATTTTGTSITDVSKHVNKTYDLSPGAGKSFSYTYDASGGTCSTVSCHSISGFQWGGSGCLNCHAISLGNRAAITGQFSSNSHHIQGVTLDGTHCYRCHWEANSDGTINPAYHGGAAAPGSAVNLVIYGAGSRPASYTLGVTALEYSATGTRTEIAKITTHCLGCHRDQNNTAMPFDDGKTPRQYAWDEMSIDLRYSQTGTTTWGKYPQVANAAQKKTTKAFSAHGNAGFNYEGWDTVNGVDGPAENQSNFTGAVNVPCFDCHNSHGSSVSEVSTSYTSSTTYGGLLKDTTAGKGGYTVTYRPLSGGSGTDHNAYKPGAALCFDCHMTEKAYDATTNPTGSTPWGYSSTFGATQKIMGYWDTPNFGQGTFASQQRYPFKAARSSGNMGGHFGASTGLTAPGALYQINGLCTPCHDPHGVSPTLGANAQYAVPLLKGTFMSSPYKEDTAADRNIALAEEEEASTAAEAEHTPTAAIQDIISTKIRSGTGSGAGPLRRSASQ